MDDRDSNERILGRVVDDVTAGRAKATEHTDGAPGPDYTVVDGRPVAVFEVKPPRTQDEERDAAD